jgi:hypothetical protein
MLKKTSPEELLQQLARDALKLNKGNVLPATDYLLARVTKDDHLFRALMRPLARQACYDLVRSFSRKNRNQVSRDADIRIANVGQRQRVEALAAGTATTLFDFPLPGGPLLGEATREELLAAAEFYHKQADDMDFKYRWLKRVASMVPEGKIAKDVLTDKQLTSLYEKAKKS